MGISPLQIALKCELKLSGLLAPGLITGVYSAS